ncbi:unnamed protein product [Nezara viridula]|nr:unnamed protein product [Nezara viridula]
MKTYTPPADKEKECAVGCVMEKLGFIKDVTMIWDVVKASNPDRYDTPENVEKANQVVDACAKIVSGKGTDLCELGVKGITCLRDQTEKAQLQFPHFSFE